MSISVRIGPKEVLRVRNIFREDEIIKDVDEN